MIHSLIAVTLVALSALAVATFPRSVLVFLLFQGALLFVFKARIPERLRWDSLVGRRAAVADTLPAGG